MSKLHRGANRVVPTEAADAVPDPAPTEEARESLAQKAERDPWSDSDYSTDASFRSSSAGDSVMDRSPPTSSSRGSRHRVTPNPLLLAFPERSHQEFAGRLSEEPASQGNVQPAAENSLTSPRKGKTGI